MTCPECGLGIPDGESACPICGFAADPAAVEQAERRHALLGPAIAVRPLRLPAAAEPAEPAAAEPAEPATAAAGTRHRSERMRARLSEAIRALFRHMADGARSCDRLLVGSIRYKWDFLPEQWWRFEHGAASAFAGWGRRIGDRIGTGLWKGIRLALLLSLLLAKGVAILAALVAALVSGALSAA